VFENSFKIFYPLATTFVFTLGTV